MGRGGLVSVPKEREALAVIEGMYGSLDEFAYFVYWHHPELLRPKVRYSTRARVLGVDESVLRVVMSTDRWRDLIERVLADAHWSVEDKARHVEILAAKATDASQRVRDLITAGKYLDLLRGRDLDARRPQRTTTPKLIIQFGGPEEVDGYTPLKSGDKPKVPARKQPQVSSETEVP